MPKDDQLPTCAARGCFHGRTHVLPIRIYYEDTDYARHIYHANYVRYLERGRSEFLRAIGMDHTTMLNADVPRTFVITNMSMNFVRPARIDDTLLVHTNYDRFRGARVFNRQIITRGEEIILECDSEMALVSLDGQPRRPSRQFLEAFRPYLADAKPACRAAPANVPTASIREVAEAST